MALLDELNALDPIDPAEPLFEELTEEELAEQQKKVELIGKKVLAEEAQTGKRSEARDALMVKAVDPYEYLVSRGKQAIDISSMEPRFVAKLASAIQEAEAGTGQRAQINSGYRDREEQARLYQRYREGRGGLAAKPGMSRHERGIAADVAHGPVLEWLIKNRQAIKQRYGIDFLSGKAFARDRVHIQEVDPKTGMVRPAGYDAFLGKQKPETSIWPSVSHTDVPSGETLDLTVPEAGAASVDEAGFIEHAEDLPEWPDVDMARGQTGDTVGELPITEQLRILEEAAKTRPPDTGPMYASGVEPVPAPEQKPTSLPGLEGFTKLSNAVQEPFKQLGAGAIGGLAGGINQVMGLIANTPSLFVNRENKLAESFANQADMAKHAGREVFQVGEPQNAVEKFAYRLGESFNPAGAYTAPWTAFSFGMKSLGDYAGEAQAQTKREQARVKREQAIEAGQTAVDTVVESIGGPYKVPAAEYATIGGMFAATAGAIFAPVVYSKFKFGGVPYLPQWKGIMPILEQRQLIRQGRATADTVPGTLSYSRNADLARTADDANAGALAIAKRYMDPKALEKVENVFQFQTRSNANAAAESAPVNGQMNLPTFSFKVPTSLQKLARTDSPQTREYLNLWHMAEELIERERVWLKKSGPAQAQAGVPNINGMSKQDVINQIRQFERANPELKQVEKAWRENVREMYRFQATGEYATLSKQKHRDVSGTQAHIVPFPEGVDRYALNSSPFDYMMLEMKNRLRQRMENEALGTYVDEMRKTRPDSFKSLDAYAASQNKTVAQVLEDNPAWKKNTVQFYRRGKLEAYSTDPFLADVLKFDPYYMNSAATGTLNTMRNLFQRTTTGDLAPWFAFTAGPRALQQGKLTAHEGWRSPTTVGSLLAVWQQTYPQAGKFLADQIEVGNLNWFTKAGIPRGVLDNLGTRLMTLYDQSMYAMLARSGGFEGGWMQGYTPAMNQLQALSKTGKGFGKNVFAAWHELLNAMHNAPNFNYAKRNIDIADSMSQLAVRSKDLTGDPRVGGQYYVGKPGVLARPIRMEGTNDFGNFVADRYAYFNQLSRETIPWYNVIQQSIKKTGQAYLDDPMKFTGRAWLYSAMPAAAEYFYARSLGNDPNGRSYVDYMMNGRPIGQRMLSWYIPIPGKPVEDAVTVPTFQELSIVRAMMHNAVDHLSGSSVFSEKKDFEKAAYGYLGVTAGLPAIPLMNLTLGSQGMSGLYGMFDESYRRRVDPYNQNAGMAHSLELMGRALAPGIIDIVASGYAALANSDKDAGITNALGNAVKDMGKTAARKAPMFRDVVGITPMASGVTPITVELYKKDKVINDLDRWMKRLERGEDLVSRDKEGKLRDYKSKLGSDIFERIWKQQTGGKEFPPAISPGLSQPEPTNPLWKDLITELHTRFKKDEPVQLKTGEPVGGVGFRTAWIRYNIATEALRRLRDINAGNQSAWELKLANQPEVLEYLKREKINYRDPVRVKNHYEGVRQQTGRILLNTIQHVEDQMSKKAGRPIKLEDLAPYVSQDAGANTDMLEGD